ncbi:MAG TPA: hypothetical protein VFC51_10020 [Chloroflexota bacterium]|nr:hypothetical protein [Chloroflexota bacterium]
MAVSGSVLRVRRSALAAFGLRLGLFPLAPAFALLVLYAFVYVRFAIRLMAFPFGWDQGEGYDAWGAWLTAHGQLPYSQNGAFPFFSINYPPVWSLLVALPEAIAGPSLAPARIFSTLIALVDVALIGAAAWRRTRSGTPYASPLIAACLAGGFFLASPYVFHTTPLARLNSTLTLFTLLALTCAERPTPRRTVLCTVFLLAGIFTKPTGLFAAAACLVWLVGARPRLGVIASCAFGVTTLALVASLNLLTGGAYWLNVVTANAGQYDLTLLGRYLVNFAIVHPVVLAFGCTEAWRALRGRAWSPWLAALGASLGQALLVGHVGAGESYFLDFIAVACVLSGAAIARITASTDSSCGGIGVRGSAPLRRRAGELLAAGGSPIVLLGALVLVQALLMAHGPVSRHVDFLPDRGLQGWILGREPTADDQDAGEEIVQLVRSSQGPVLLEEPSFAIAAGKEVVANASHLRDLDEVGLWDAQALVTDIRDRRFGIIVLSAQRYPASVLEAIGRSYYIARSLRMGAGTYSVFLPGG